MILVVLLYALLASTFTLGGKVIAYASPVLLIGIRMTIGGLILLGYQYLFGAAAFRFKKKDFFNFMLIALFHVYVTYIAEFWALQQGMAPTKISLFFNLMPFCSAFFSYLVFTEKMTFLKWIGLTIGFVGMLPVLLERASDDIGSGIWQRFSYAELAALISVVSAAYGWIMVRKLIQRQGYPVVAINGVGMFTGGIAALGTAFFVESAGIQSFWTETVLVPGKLLWFAFYLGLLILLANIICYNLYGYLLKIYSATWLAFAGFVTPLFTAGFDALLLEKTALSWGFFASLICVTCGLFIFYQEELRQGYIQNT